MDIQNLKPRILNFQVASLKNTKSPLELNAEQLQIRQDCAAILNQKDSRQSVEYYYNSDIIAPNGIYKVDNKLYQRILSFRTSKTSKNPNLQNDQLQNKILSVRSQQIDRQIENSLQDLNQINEQILKNTPQTPKNFDDLSDQIAEKQTKLEQIQAKISMKLAELKALKEYSLVQKNAIKENLTYSQRLQILEDLQVQCEANQALETLCSGMIQNLQNIISNVCFEEVLKLKRTEVCQNDIDFQNQIQTDQQNWYDTNKTDLKSDILSETSIFNQINLLLNSQCEIGTLELLKLSENNVKNKQTANKQLEKSIELSGIKNDKIKKLNQIKSRVPVKQTQAFKKQDKFKERVTQLTDQMNNQIFQSPIRIESPKSTLIPQLESLIPQFDDQDMPEPMQGRIQAGLILQEQLNLEQTIDQQYQNRVKHQEIEIARIKALERQKEYDRKQAQQKSSIIDRKTLLLQERDERLKKFQEKIEVEPPKRFSLPKKKIVEDQKEEVLNKVMQKLSRQEIKKVDKQKEEIDSIQQMLDEIELDLFE